MEPEDAGLPRAPIAAIHGGDAAFNAVGLEAVLQGAPGAYRDTVLLNAAAALIVAGQAGDLREGVSIAADAIASGAAFAALETLRRASAVTVSCAEVTSMPDDTELRLPDVLARICADTRAEVAARKAERGVDALRSEIAARRDAAARLRRRAEAGDGRRAITG